MTGHTVSNVEPTTITYEDVARAAEDIRAATAEHEARLAKSRQAAAVYLRLEWNCDERQVVAIQTELEERVWNREDLDAEQMVELITRHGGKRVDVRSRRDAVRQQLEEQDARERAPKCRACSDCDGNHHTGHEYAEFDDADEFVGYGCKHCEAMFDACEVCGHPVVDGVCRGDCGEDEAFGEQRGRA